MLQVRRYPDARAFLARAEPWLLEAEIERGPVLASARQAFIKEATYEKPVYWATIEEDGKIIGCAYRTPPFRVGVTALPTAALAPLSLDLEKTYKTISGFSGVDPAASALADVWIARHGGSSAIVSRQFLWTLPPDAPPSVAPGALQLATPNDSMLAKSWGDALARESGVAALDGALCERLIGARQLYFWQHGGRRCMLGLMHGTPRAAALGIVYTPPEHRGHYYATSAVSALNGELLARGLEQRYFYIDPANRAAQALSRKIGCELVQAAVDIDFR
jgi:RimJ/RimL family protein N-acetyltransferase